MRMRLMALAMVLGAALSALADPGYYAKRDGWRETMVAAREALIKSEAEAARNPKPAAKDPVTLGPWYRIGPFAEKGACTFADVAPPETEIVLDKVYGADKLAWAKADYADGEVHDLPGKDAANTYLYRTITAAKAIALTGYFGSDDGLVVWFNGEKLLSQDVPRGAGPNQAQAKLTMKAGENKLLLKIHNNTGGHGFYFALQDSPKGADPKVEARNGIWSMVERDFTDDAARRQMQWERAEGIWNQDWTEGDLRALATRYVNAVKVAHLKAEATRLAAAVKAPADLVPLGAIYEKSQLITQGIAGMKAFDSAPLRRALDDLMSTYGDKYPRGKDFLARLDALEKAREAAIEGAQKGDATAVEGAAKTAGDLETLKREVLLANPLVAELDKLVYVKRRTNQLGLPQNWQGNTSVARTGYDNQIDQLSLRDGSVTTVYKPEGGRFVGNLYMHWDAERMLFSMPNADNRWQIFEVKPNGQGLREVGPNDEPDVDNYDACYLPSGKIIFCSTRVFHGVPCVGGSDAVGNLCVMDSDGKNVRMLAFDQDHNWCPTVTNDGRVMYTRWEYSDTAHYFTRILFKMNPDGTRQMEMYGSNSFWPNSMFYTRAIPNDPTKVVTIVSGHHGVPRMGELAILDPAKGRREADGAEQLIPGWGKKVEPKIEDQLVNNSWPKFLHPYPLSDKYFLVASQPTAQSNWGLYLVDKFDNMLLLKEEPGYALFEPVAVLKRPVPPVIPEAVKLDRQDASVYVADVYSGPGLRGVPRGTVKSLRFYTPYYSYNNMGGHINIGIEGPWDVRRILGTVPVNDDGSVAFNVPANTPISFQAVDKEGRALQQMRSWYTAMPGEVISCAGCHESQNDTIVNRPTTAAARRQPYDIAPWRGPIRGFSWKRDIQPQVLDKYCVGCHDGTSNFDGKPHMDLRASNEKGWGGFDKSYIALHPYVRRHGPEGDDRMLAPMDFFANTSELVQMLQKGHYNVKLDEEAWDRLYTWIDLNVPDHGTWAEHRQIPGNNVGTFHQRRIAMRTKYANNPDDPEVIPDLGLKPVAFVKPDPEPLRVTAPPNVPGWPFDADTARRTQVASATELAKTRPVANAAEPTRRVVDLGGGQTMEFVLVPAGEYAMGSISGARDESPVTRVRIDKPFWMSVTEVTNAQYNAFDPKHNSAHIDMQHKDHTHPGYPANLPQQPVVRVNWNQANDFCSWLSRKTGALVQLPTEGQWEWACRAGTDSPFWFGGLDTDFGKMANLADQTIKLLAVDGVNPQPVANPNPIFQDFVPRERRFNDGKLIATDVGGYEANPWGLRDMHGNVAEWTRSDYKPYPYADNDGRNDVKANGLKSVRGGSWRERPFRATSSWRLGYYTYQPVWDVGFRVILEDNGGKPAVAMAPTR